MLSLLTLVALAWATGCETGEPDVPPDGRPSVVATTGMIADLAAALGGGHVRVTALMPPGVDPHLFKASEGDVRRLGEADLILYNGLGLEGKMGGILEKMGRSRPVVAVAEGLDAAALLAAQGYPGEYDPHVWFDVSLWAACIEPVATALADLVPDAAREIRAAADALERDLDELDRWVATEIGALPEERRVLITAHDAFGYFGARYGVEVVGLQGISTVTEAGLADVERLVDRIVRERVPAIFVESSVSRRSIEAVQEACEARGHPVVIGGQLFSDSMGAAGTPEGTYVGMVRRNVRTIVEALR